MLIDTVGIIGAGTMGNGIAQACSVSGIKVVMVDITDAAVAKGLATIEASLARLIKKDKLTPAQRDEEVTDIGLGHGTQIVDPAQVQVLAVAAQIAPVGTDGVDGHATLDGEVVEVAL